MKFGRGWAELRSRSGTLSQLIGEEVGVSYAIIYASPSLVFTFYMASTPPFISVFMSPCPRGEDSWDPPPTPNTHTHAQPFCSGLCPWPHTLEHTLFTPMFWKAGGV